MHINFSLHLYSHGQILEMFRVLNEFELPKPDALQKRNAFYFVDFERCEGGCGEWNF